MSPQVGKEDSVSPASRRGRTPRHRAHPQSTWRALFTVEPGRWNTVRSFLFDSDLGITLEGIVVALVGVAFVMAAVAEALTHSTWNALLVVGGAVFIIVGAALAFIAWVNRSEP